MSRHTTASTLTHPSYVPTQAYSSPTPSETGVTVGGGEAQLALIPLIPHLSIDGSSFSTVGADLSARSTDISGLLQIKAMKAKQSTTFDKTLVNHITPATLGDVKGDVNKSRIHYTLYTIHHTLYTILYTPYTIPCAATTTGRGPWDRDCSVRSGRRSRPLCLSSTR